MTSQRNDALPGYCHINGCTERMGTPTGERQSQNLYDSPSEYTSISILPRRFLSARLFTRS
jgi:hypothetical protein